MSSTSHDRQRRRGPGTPKRRRREAASRAASEQRRRQRRLKLAGTATVIALATAIGIALAVPHSGSPGAGGARDVSTSTDPAAFDLPRLAGGGEVRLSSFRGRPTVVNFFASWCTSCEFELPGFSRVSRELRGRVNFVGVNSLETGDGMAMARRFGIDWWPLARDVDGLQASGLHDALGGRGMPITAFYDAAGKLRYVSPGALPESDLRAVLQQYEGVG